MKTLLAALVASSLALNLLLAGFLFIGRNPPEGKDTAATRVGPGRKQATPAAQPNWTDLKTDDLPALVEQLRAHGFPPHIVRAVAASRIREAYAARRRALDPHAGSRPFWHSPTADPKLMQQMRQLSREEQQALRELLGPVADHADVNTLFQGRRFDSVPPEKANDVRRILRDFDDRRSDLYAAGSSGSSEQGKRLSALDQEQLAALTAVLTPQELEAYQLRNSDTARSLRAQLSAFNPSEEEFRTLYKLQSEFDGKFGRMYGIPSPDEQQRRSAAQRQLTEQITAALGPVRGADYVRSNDYFFRQTNQLVSRLELPAETTTQIWSVKQEIEQRATSIRRDQTIPMADRMNQLAKLAEEASTKVTPLLGGARGFEAYQQNGGSWIQSLVPRTSATTGTTRVAPAPPR